MVHLCIAYAHVLDRACASTYKYSGPEVIKLFSCSTPLSTEFILLINVKMPIIVAILTFISMIDLKQGTSLFVGILVFMIC